MADAVVFCGYSRVRFGTKPAGGLVVANVLRSMGLNTGIIDHCFSISWPNLKLIIDKFVDENTKFICVSTTLLGPVGTDVNVMSGCDRLFKPIMEYIKEKSPKAIFIVGGSKITAGQPTVLPYDYIVRGQAETALKAVVAHVLRGDPLVEIAPGVVTDKVYGFNEFSENTDLRPTVQDGVIPGETLPFEFGRGCVFQCAYCNYDMLGKKFGDYNKTEEAILSVLLENYEKFGVTRYQLADDTLNDSEEKIDRIYRISQRLPFQLEYGAYIRVELLEKIAGSAQKLKDSGLRGANLGIETLNKKSGATVGKGYGMKAIKTLSDARKVWKEDVAVNINFIVGLPYDTLEDLEKQHKILVEGDFLDHVIYTPLGIPFKGDSLFSQGLHRKYYTEAKELHPHFQKTIQIYEETESYFTENLNWQTEIMNAGDAILLARHYMEDFMEKRPFIVNSVMSFCVMSLLENFTMQQLRTLRYNESNDVLTAFARNKVEKYIDLMLNPSIQIPSNTRPITLNFDPITPSGAFVGKLHVPIQFRNK